VTLNVNQLVAELPDEAQLDDSPQRALQDLIAKLSHKPVPVGAFSRLWALGTLQAKVGAAYLVHWIRSSYADADEKQRQLNETHLKAAVKVLGSMSYLRGAIMKIGQALAAYPNLLPDQFVDMLSALHFEAPPMHYSLLREFVRKELGSDPEEVFESFDTKAFAAASLGQVHRARLKSGEVVAVKIQYPNIARTIQSDFRNMMALLSPMRLQREWDSLRDQWHDICQMLEWETDYEREASFLKRARAAFREEDDIVIPKVYDEYSTKRVLTMEYLDGVHLEDYLKTNPSQEERDRFGTLIMRSSFRIAHTAKIWYSDGHPGNYIFMKDGRMGVIDFGCCRVFSDDEWAYYKEVGVTFLQGKEAYRETMIHTHGFDPDNPRDAENIKFIEEMGDWYCGYLLHEGPFDFSDPAFLRRGIELMGEIPKRGFYRALPVDTWISRHLIGLRSIAFRLQARVDMKRLSEEEQLVVD